MEEIICFFCFVGTIVTKLSGCRLARCNKKSRQRIRCASSTSQGWFLFTNTLNVSINKRILRRLTGLAREKWKTLFFRPIYVCRTVGRGRGHDGYSKRDVVDRKLSKARINSNRDKNITDPKQVYLRLTAFSFLTLFMFFFPLAWRHIAISSKVAFFLLVGGCVCFVWWNHCCSTSQTFIIPYMLTLNI